jgi:Protein of unknown function (DUF2442)
MMSELKKKFYEVQNISFEGDLMKLTIDNQLYEIDLKELAKQSNRLLYASEAHRNQYEIDGAGYGIHWNIIDEHLSIKGLLAIAKQIKLAYE